MLETVREFALERLAASGEAHEVGQRHTSWCLSVLERGAHRAFWDGLRESAGIRAAYADRLAANRLVEREHANLRAAHDRLVSSDEAEAVLAFTLACVPFWRTCGHLREANDRLAQAMAMAKPRSPSLWREALESAGGIAFMMGNLSSAAAHGRQALALSREATDAYGEANALQLLALVEENQANWDAAAELFEQALSH
jgi:hypothetical protein